MQMNYILLVNAWFLCHDEYSMPLKFQSLTDSHQEIDEKSIHIRCLEALAPESRVTAWQSGRLASESRRSPYNQPSTSTASLHRPQRGTIATLSYTMYGMNQTFNPADPSGLVPNHIVSSRCLLAHAAANYGSFHTCILSPPTASPTFPRCTPHKPSSISSKALQS
jgi:hypothetical protein